MIDLLQDNVLFCITTTEKVACNLAANATNKRLRLTSRRFCRFSSVERLSGTNGATAYPSVTLTLISYPVS
jgi:hypothetical protein